MLKNTPDRSLFAFRIRGELLELCSSCCSVATGDVFLNQVLGAFMQTLQRMEVERWPQRCGTAACQCCLSTRTVTLARSFVSPPRTTNFLSGYVQQHDLGHSQMNGVAIAISCFLAVFTYSLWHPARPSAQIQLSGGLPTAIMECIALSGTFAAEYL